MSVSDSLTVFSHPSFCWIGLPVEANASGFGIHMGPGLTALTLAHHPHTFRPASGNRKGLASSCRFSPHMPRPRTPTAPRKSYQIDFSVLASIALRMSPTALMLLTMLTWLRGCANPCGLCGSLCTLRNVLRCSRLPQSKPPATLRRMRNTRYGWLVRPYEFILLNSPSGTFTPKEATSFACRTNAKVSGTTGARDTT